MKHFLPAALSNLVLGILIFSPFGCSKFDPAEPIPSYIHIDKLTLTSIGPDQGSSTSDIKDAWIYMDNNLVGAFQLPCTVPILADGTHHFIVKGGVLMNGLVSTRAIYPFWRGWESDLTLTRGKVTTIGTQTLNYFPGTDFVGGVMDFNLASALTNDQTSNAVITCDPSGAFEGAASGHIHIDLTTTPYALCYNTPQLLPNTSDVWVEFDYKSTTAFTVGVIDDSIGVSSPWLTIDPTPTWRTIYVRLTDVLEGAADTQTVPYNVYFGMLLPDNASSADLYLDNIK